MKKILITVMIAVVFIGIVAGVARQYRAMYPVIKYHDVEVDVTDKKFAEKIDSLEKSVVSSVRSCESGGKPESFGLVTYDPKKGGVNNDSAMSYGTLQFKKATVIFYYKKLYNQVITGKDAILIALDDGKSGSLAQDIMFKVPNGWQEWYNCSSSLSLEYQINAIKKIQ